MYMEILHEASRTMLFFDTQYYLVIWTFSFFELIVALVERPLKWRSCLWIEHGYCKKSKGSAALGVVNS